MKCSIQKRTKNRIKELNKRSKSNEYEKLIDNEEKDKELESRSKNSMEEESASNNLKETISCNTKYTDIDKLHKIAADFKEDDDMKESLTSTKCKDENSANKSNNESDIKSIDAEWSLG